MSSGLHEVLIELVEVVPGLLPDLLTRTSGRDLPAFTHITGSSETANIKVPVEHRADAVRTFLDSDNKPVLATVIEVQLAKKNSKPWVWPVFVAEVRRLHMCQTVVLVVVPDADTATWARQPLDLGLGCSFVTPLVIDLSELNPINDENEAASDIGSAMLAALSAKTSPNSLDVLSAALAKHAADEAKQYAGLMLSALRGAAQDYWRKLMTAGTYAYQNDYARELIAKGEKRGIAKGEKRGIAKGEAKGEKRGIAKGEAKAIFRILNHRGIAISDHARDRINACTDSAVLDVWMDRALEANTIDDILDEPES